MTPSTRSAAARTAAAFCCAALTAGLAACGSSSNPAASDGPTTGTPPATGAQYVADVRRTEFGIPHIKADDWGSLGYGVGYSYAEDNVCTLAEDILTIDGERSKFFGPDGTHDIIDAFAATNRESDFAFRLLVTPEKTAEFKAAQSTRSLDVGTGYAEGYSRYVRELQAGQHAGRHAACRDAEWLREITVDDLIRRYIRLAMLASSTVFRPGIFAAQPPVGGASKPGDPASQKAARRITLEDSLDYFANPQDRHFGSNMYGIGPGGTADGSTMLLGNPHFPWYGPERLHALHITIPGVVDTIGTTLHGSPVPLIGFNDRFAWSHTVSAAYRFTFYQLTLAPGDPTSYVVDGETRAMIPSEITIEVLGDDGTLTEESRTLYMSEYGPMVVIADDALDWGTNTAYTLRDANYENTRLIEQFINWNAADDFEDFKTIHGSTLGVPWVNTVAIGPDADAYYGDVTVVPNVPDSMTSAGPELCTAEPAHTAVQALVPGLPVLDGSRADCNWRTDTDAPAPGIFGPANLPTLERADYVHNCNDSYWLTHPDEPLTGFAEIIGNEDAPRSLRTRMCITQPEQRIDGQDDLADTLFTFGQFQDTVLGSRVYSAEIERDNVITGICDTAVAGMLNGSGGAVDVAEACTVLAAWDMRTNKDSVGAHIWREFWTRADDVDDNLQWLTPYDSADPVNTPRDLNTTNLDVRTAFADGVQAVADAGVAFDAPFGTVQYDVKNGVNIPMFGGLGSVGNFTISIPFDEAISSDGYAGIEYGNSWVYTINYRDDAPNGAMVAEGFVTYSQSTDSASPHFSDMTVRYGNKQWIPLPFFDDEITDAQISQMTLTGPRPD